MARARCARTALPQVWKTPSFEKQMCPMQLHRTYGQCHADVLDLDWSPDSQFIAVASKDIVARCVYWRSAAPCAHRVDDPCLAIARHSQCFGEHNSP